MTFQGFSAAPGVESLKTKTLKNGNIKSGGTRKKGSLLLHARRIRGIGEGAGFTIIILKPPELISEGWE
jgi:hypothetical protein